MPYLFADSSVLVKLYHDEAGTQEVTARYESRRYTWVTSILSVVEFHSVVARHVRDGEISETKAEQAIDGFQDDCADGRFEVLETGQETWRRAAALLRKEGMKAPLRALDAIQLAFALDLREREGDVEFASADKRQVRVARDLGFAVFDPGAA